MLRQSAKRPASRLLVINAEGRVLLFRFAFDDGALAGRTYWATPGGALEPGETFAFAASRELAEETGIVANVGAEFSRRRVHFQTPSGQVVDADERFFVVRAADQTVWSGGRSIGEERYIKEHRWWSVADLNATSDIVYPEELADWLAAAIANRAPIEAPQGR